MKNIIKYSVNYVGFILTLSAVLIFGCRCSPSKPIPDPLAGWNTDFNQPDQAIVKDYQEYIQKLPQDQQKYASLGRYFEDGTGQHAVVVVVALNGTWWNHVLIYDKDNKRIKVIKYSPGRYRS